MKGSNLKDTDELAIEVVLKGRYVFPYYTGHDSIYYYMVDVKLTNNTDSIIKFLAYDCSTAANIVVDKEYVTLCAMNCGGNSKAVIKLKPKQEFSLPVILMANLRYEQSQVRIGFILLQPTKENFWNFTSLLESYRKSLKNVVWSSAFELTMNGHPYEIR
jgi:hypothetical protein